MKFILIIALIALSACSKTPDIPYASPAIADGQVSQAPAAAPAIAQATAPAHQAPAAGSSMTDMLLAGGAGYLLGSSGRSAAPAPQPQTVIHQTIIKKTVVQEAPKPAAVVPPPRRRLRRR